jgi:putative ABC transport system permease protein
MGWIARLWRRRRLERQLAAELRDHIEREAATLRTQGVSDVEARRRAQLAFGGVEQIKEQCRDARGARWIDTTLQDLRLALRGVRRNPGLSLAIILSLGLGIGANTTIYSVIRATLLRPLPVPNPQELVQLVAFDRNGDVEHNSVSYRMFAGLRSAVGRGGHVFAVNGADRTRLSLDGDQPEYAIVEAVSANYFQALGVGAAAGRLLVDADDAPSGREASGGNAVAVLSHAFWTRRFGEDAGAIGRRLQIGGTSYEIVGVAADGFRGVESTAHPDLWLPATTRLPRHWLTMSGSQVLRIMARIDPRQDARPLEAAADVAYRQEWLEYVVPGVPPDLRELFSSRHLRFRSAAAGLSSLGERYRRAFTVLMVSVALVLVLCCANVANLTLARSRVREREFAVRLSLGAGRGRLARQLLTESAVLGGIGALAGLALAWWGTNGLAALLPTGRMPVDVDLSPDRATLTGAMLLTLASTLAAGALPALRASRTPLAAVSRESRATLRMPVARSLVIVQVACSLVLLVVATLMARTLDNLRTLDLGFVAERVMTFDLSFPDEATAPDKAGVYRRVVDRLSSTPGVSDVTYSAEPVYSDGGWAGSATGPVGERVPASARTVAFLRVGPRFFDVLGMRRIAGRPFTDDDHGPGRRRVVVNQTFARHFFGAASPIGQSVDLTTGGAVRYEIVGVVRDAQHYGAREQPCGGRVAYLAMDPSAPQGAVFVRSTRTLADLSALLRAEVTGAHRGVLVDRLRPLDRDVRAMVGRERLVGFLSGGFAVLALMLAAIGLYGVLAYGVAERRPELGLRAALGAEPGSLARLVLGDASRVLAAGAALGALGALAGARLVSTLLFGVTPFDPFAFAGAALLLLLVATVASYLPARRAARVDPTVALRAE